MGRTISFTEVGEFDAPPERMFWFMVDPANASRVDPSIVSWQPGELPPRVGTHNDLVGKGPLGIKMRVVSKFTEFDPPHRMVVESVMPARPVFGRGIHDIEPLDCGRCRYTYTLEFTPSRGGALMARMMRWWMRRGVRIGTERRIPDLLREDA